MATVFSKRLICLEHADKLFMFGVNGSPHKPSIVQGKGFAIGHFLWFWFYYDGEYSDALTTNKEIQTT